MHRNNLTCGAGKIMAGAKVDRLFSANQTAARGERMTKNQ